jgi:hypothetical protein
MRRGLRITRVQAAQTCGILARRTRTDAQRIAHLIPNGDGAAVPARLASPRTGLLAQTP